ncbi:MAG: 5'/3'-nucleotidase SurE [Desulfobacula sp.]|nr:5'/3'-nucleotidase SurE [Desulfobacula sp.]
MKILITNDDGYAAPGIQTLYQTLQKTHDVTLVAPDREKSAVGHGISLDKPLRIESIQLDNNNRGYAINGTPADCVKLALFEFFPAPPDLVIAGINPGSNTGVNINYSGTVAAAREAALNGIQAMAVSLEVGKYNQLDFSGMSVFIETLIEKISSFTLAPGTFLNINAPDMLIGKTHGIKITRQSQDNVSKNFEKRADPKTRPYFWYGRICQPESGLNTDTRALSQNFISISPIQCDTTDADALSLLKDIEQLK